MMLNRRHAVLGLIAAPLLLRNDDAVTLTRPAIAFGTMVRLTVTTATAAQAQAALTAGFAEIRAVEEVFSLFNPASELSRLNAQGHLKFPSQMLRDVIALTDVVWARTSGAFDPTVQPLWKLWAIAKGAMPGARAVETSRQSVGWQHVAHSAREVSCKRRGMALTFNGIAQGFAADRVTAALQQREVISAQIDTGEFSLLRNGDSRRFDIRDPRNADRAIASLDLRDGFIATSGDYASSFTADFSAHHILDPATGFSPRELSSVTVVAKTGAEADAYATAMMVMGPDRSLAMAKAQALDVVLVDKAGAVVRS